MSTGTVGARVPTSTRSDSTPAAAIGIGEKGELVALGVGRADHVDALHIILPTEPQSSRCWLRVPAPADAWPLHFFETCVSY